MLQGKHDLSYTEETSLINTNSFPEMESQRQQNDIQSAQRKKPANQKFYIQQNYPTKKEGKITKTFPD